MLVKDRSTGFAVNRAVVTSKWLVGACEVKLTNKVVIKATTTTEAIQKNGLSERRFLRRFDLPVSGHEVTSASTCRLGSSPTEGLIGRYHQVPIHDAEPERD